MSLRDLETSATRQRWRKFGFLANEEEEEES
jgi:hypothetical protein